MTDKRRKSDPNSELRKQYQRMVDKFYAENGYVDWSELGITNYIRGYHDLDIYAASIANPPEIDEKIASIVSEARPSDPACSRYVITTAMRGWDIDEKFLASLIAYCEHNSAKLLVIPRASTMKELIGETPIYIDDNAELVELEDYSVEDVEYFKSIEEKSRRISIVNGSIRLNSQITLLDVFINPRIANPIAPLKNVGPSIGSVVVGSPKIVMEATPSAKNKLPYIQMSTGCINLPYYQAREYKTTQEAVAEVDHAVGALVVEIEDSNYFHYRHVTASNDGSFVDFGVRYSPSGSRSIAKTEAIVLGDWHSGYTCPIVASSFAIIRSVLNPEYVVLHDMIDGHSINHHEKDDMIAQMNKYYDNKLDVMAEMAGVVHDLNWFIGQGVKPIVVKSNHDDFVDKFLNSKQWQSNPAAYLMFSQLAARQSKAAFLKQDLDLAREALIIAAEFKGLSLSDSIVWLERDVECQIAGIDISHHGDKIANGRPSSMPAVAKHLGKCVIGHTHSPAIFRGAYRVGTSSYLDLSYNKGPSNWLHTMCAIYDDGSRQLINIIDGKIRPGMHAVSPAPVASTGAHLAQ